MFNQMRTGQWIPSLAEWHIDIYIHTKISTPPTLFLLTTAWNSLPSEVCRTNENNFHCLFFVCVCDLDWSHLEVQVDKESLKDIFSGNLLSVKPYFNPKVSWEERDSELVPYSWTVSCHSWPGHFVSALLISSSVLSVSTNLLIQSQGKLKYL